MGKKLRFQKILWYLAGILLLSVFLLAVYPPQKPPQLDVRTVGPGRPGGGFYYHAADVAELENGNPWTPQSRLRRLPIFRQNDLEQELEPQQRLALAQEFGARFGVQVFPSPHEHTHTFTDFAGGTIRVLGAGSYQISFDQLPFGPPDWFPDSVATADEEQTLSMLNFFLKRYGKTLGIEKPVDCTDRYPDHRLYVSAYEGKGNLTERFVAWHFNRVGFFYDEGSFIISRRTPDDLERIGYYPILSPDEARQMLLEGFYTTNPYSPGGADRAPAPDPDKIAGVDLIYFPDYFSVTVPFYQFYLPAPLNLVGQYFYTDGRDQGEVLQSYFVPAIPPEYVKNPSVFGARFADWTK